MIEYLNNLDASLLLAVNNAHCQLFDVMMKIISGKLTWAVLYAAMLYVVFKRFDWRTAIVMLLGIALSITLADQVCASLIRPLVERMRPTNLNNPLSEMVHVVDNYRGGAYGFPSCHAANTFALAVFTALMFARRAYSLFIIVWCIIVCYSRVYLGVHYPGDILVGAAIGSLVGLACFRLAALACRSLKLNEKPLDKVSIAGGRSLSSAQLNMVIIWAAIATFAVIFVISIARTI